MNSASKVRDAAKIFNLPIFCCELSSINWTAPISKSYPTDSATQQCQCRDDRASVEVSVFVGQLDFVTTNRNFERLERMIRTPKVHGLAIHIRFPRREKACETTTTVDSEVSSASRFC